MTITNGKHISNRDKPFSPASAVTKTTLSCLLQLPSWKLASLGAISTCFVLSGFLIQISFVFMNLLATASVSFKIYAI